MDKWDRWVEWVTRRIDEEWSSVDGWEMDERVHVWMKGWIERKLDECMGG